MDTNLATPRVRSGRVVIAGGGLAGQRCAEALRRKGFDGQITIICAEARRPYDRPPLSKELLEQAPLGDAPSFRSVEWYERESVQLSLGVSATDLVPGERRLSLSDGSSLRYDWLVIATGSRPRRLPLLDGYDNVSVLRTLDDCQRLRDALAQRPRLAVIGAGFIGQEVAATARRLGLSVTMIEAAPCPLIGVLGVQLGEWFERLHREEGVEMLMSRTVDGVSANGTVRALRLSDHSVVEADHIVVGVGVEPDIAWLHDSGLTVDGLIPVDPHGRTAADRVLAIGDAAATFDPLAGRHLPGSHWEAAGRQGTRAAHVILGLPPGPAPVTSFWTDQYGIRIQYLGRAHLADSVQYDGEPDSRSFTATFLRAGRAVAALLVDRPRALPAARKLIEKGTS
jgi:NADPH-dependent 2,4-dienoyl-CoA reductase/sulfur reductase-like enzyme